MGAAVAHDSGGEPLVQGPGGFPVASQEGAAALNDSELLRSAPWLDQTNGSPSLTRIDALPSLVFPAGTTYDEAIEALYAAAKTTGALPPDADLAPPLPKQIVFARSADRSVLSLTAPFGYDVNTGNVLAPSVYFPPSLTSEEIERASEAARASRSAIPAGAKVVGNPLAACQVMTDENRTPEC